ncbi:MAG: putative thioesterase [bacterium]|nr:putative thioesterase [bacterium]
MQSQLKKWLPYNEPRSDSALRIFCFPYAGGGASAFRAWKTRWPQSVEICPVLFPGREIRLSEPPFTRMDALIPALEEALAECWDRPFALFGYSMGAAVAFELTRRLHQRGARLPECVWVCARRSPILPYDEDQTYLLPDPEFRAKLRDLNGTPASVLENEELMEIILPAMRADFELNETYRLSESVAPVPVPLVALGGLRDGEVSNDQLRAWSALTTGPFRSKQFGGDHFFIQTHQNELFHEMQTDIQMFL